MSTQTIHRTTCGACGKVYEHVTRYPAGWGHIEINRMGGDGYIVSGKSIKDCCSNCLDRAELAIGTELGRTT